MIKELEPELTSHNEESILNWCNDPNHDAGTSLDNFITLMKKYVDSVTYNIVFEEIANGMISNYKNN